MNLFRAVQNTGKKPSIPGWHWTSKGQLYWFQEEQAWSCRDDRVSHEYPEVWFEETNIEDIEELQANCKHKNTSTEFCGGSEYRVQCDDCKKILES